MKCMLSDKNTKTYKRIHRKVSGCFQRAWRDSCFCEHEGQLMQ